MEVEKNGVTMGETIAMGFTLNDVCTLCGGTNRIPIKPFTIEVDDKVHHYWLCKCGMIYLNAYPTDQRFFYADYYKATFAIRHGQRAQDRSNRTIEALPDDWDIKSHLDVGCGTDMLMDLVEEKYPCKGEGVEFDPQWVKSHKRYTVITDVKKTYDLVTAIHVVEHDPNPLQLLKEIARVANKYIVMEVPSVGQSITEESLMHVSIFSPWTLERMVQKAGIGIRSIEWIQVVTETYSHAVLSFSGEVDKKHKYIPDI